MSALEQSPLPTSNPVVERRGEERTRITTNISVSVGRGKGALVDVSQRGIRVRHSVQAQRGTTLRVSFEWQGERFAATAEILASRVVALGDANRPTMYESRLRFGQLTESDRQLLQRLPETAQSHDERKWVANLHGWIDTAVSQAAEPTAPSSYLRCRLLGNRWERKWTNDPAQPLDGFTLPDTAEAREIDDLCDTYRSLDDEGRKLVRVIAAATVS